MALNNFFQVNMPYCLKVMPGGGYVVLNREYKPIGFRTTDRIRYEDLPITQELKGLTARMAAALDCNGRGDGDHIYLYDDSCPPYSDKGFMDAYLVRLQKLAHLRYAENVPFTTIAAKEERHG